MSKNISVFRLLTQLDTIKFSLLEINNANWHLDTELNRVTRMTVYQNPTLICIALEQLSKEDLYILRYRLSSNLTKYIDDILAGNKYVIINYDSLIDDINQSHFKAF